MAENMRFHHTGCLVADIDSALVGFAHLASGPPGPPIFVAKQQVTICMVPLAGGSYVELICPGPSARGLRALLDGGTNFYHLAFLVDGLEETLDRLLNEGFQIVASFHSEAFGGAICAFVKTPTGELVELIQEASNG